MIPILVFLSIGEFLLPALAGGRARAIAGIVIAGIATGGLIVPRSFKSFARRNRFAATVGLPPGPSLGSEHRQTPF